MLSKLSFLQTFLFIHHSFIDIFKFLFQNCCLRHCLSHYVCVYIQLNRLNHRIYPISQSLLLICLSPIPVQAYRYVKPDSVYQWLAWEVWMNFTLAPPLTYFFSGVKLFYDVFSDSFYAATYFFFNSEICKETTLNCIDAWQIWTANLQSVL